MATLETRRAKQCGGTDWGFVVSVVGGPRDLLWRASEADALSDGAEYVRRHWSETPDGWRPSNLAPRHTEPPRRKVRGRSRQEDMMDIKPAIDLLRAKHKTVDTSASVEDLATACGIELAAPFSWQEVVDMIESLAMSPYVNRFWIGKERRYFASTCEPYEGPRKP